MTRRSRPFWLPKRRLALWLLPLLVPAVLWLGYGSLEAHGTLDQAEQLLVEGDYRSALELLRPLRDHWQVGAEARAGHAVALAFEDDDVASAALRQRLDHESFDLPLIIRAAFERAEFGTVLRLTELAETLGRPTIPWVTVAAQIESTGGAPRTGSIPRLADSALPARSLLVQRVTHHLETRHLEDPAAVSSGIAVRDRFGRPLGRLEDGRLQVDAGIRPEWIPKATAAFVEDHSDAGSVRTSLDLELSKAAFEAFGRYRGSIVLVDPMTGEILAAVSDRRTHRREAGTAAFEQGREPASISKLITTAAYIRSGLNPDRTFRRMDCRGHEYFDGTPLYCPSISGDLKNLNRAMAVSCNVAFARLAREIGRPSLLRELRRFGFDRDLGQFRGGRILQPGGDQRQLADLAIGLQATEITPLHAALLAATVANDGIMPEPTLLHSRDGKLGLHPELLPRGEDRRVLDPPAVNALRRSMEAVVNGGTATRVRTPGFPVAMKTGTASDPRYGFHVNYIGFGPLPDSRIAFCVRITDQRTSRRVRMAAAEVTGRLLRRLRTLSRQRNWQTTGSVSPEETGRLVKLGDRLSAREVAELPPSVRFLR